MAYPVTSVPLSYSTPPFPSLYWPISAPPGAARFLYSTTAIWRFTLYWTMITFSIVHAAAAAWAVLMQLRSAVVLHRKQHARKRRLKEAPPGDDSDEGSSSEQVRPGTATTTGSSAVTAPPAPLLTPQRPIFSTLGWVWVIPLVYMVVGLLEALLSGSLVGLLAGAVYNAGNFKMSTWMPFLWGMINCLVVILGSFRLQGGL